MSPEIQFNAIQVTPGIVLIPADITLETKVYHTAMADNQAEKPHLNEIVRT